MSIAPVRWDSEGADVRLVREAVFVLEQGVPRDLEMDGRDPACVHVLARQNGRPVGTARMLPDGHIGRVSVLASLRGRGIGRRMMQELIRIAADNGLRRVYLHSQTSAAGFYREMGFIRRGAEFMEAGIRHVEMILEIGRSD